jgi:hypothetical protein
MRCSKTFFLTGVAVFGLTTLGSHIPADAQSRSKTVAGISIHQGAEVPTAPGLYLGPKNVPGVNSRLL